MLTVTKNDISYISYTKSVYQDCSCVYSACYLCTLAVKLQNISGCKDKDILFGDSKFLNHIFLCGQMSVFTMNRDCIFRFYQRIDQLDFFLAGMSGNMDILENNLRTLHGKLIDNLGYRFLISRNRIRTEDNRIVWLYRHFSVHVRRHSRQSRHRLSLTSGCDKNHFLRRIILHLIDLDQCVFRHIQISQF